MNYYDLTAADPSRLAARPGMEFWMGLSASTDIAGDERLLKQSINDKSRQDMSVMSNMFAMTCPFNPLGMLLGMLMLNHFEGQYRNEHLSGHEEMLQRRIDMAKALAAVQARRYMLDSQKKNQPSAIETIDSWMTRNKEPKKPQSAEDKQKEKDKAKRARQQAQEAADRDSSGVILPSSAQSHTQVSKLLKAKSALESQKYQLSQNQDYHGNAAVSAKIDVLDAILKRI